MTNAGEWPSWKPLPKCVRCGRKDPEAQGFQRRDEGYVCCVCLKKQDEEHRKMLTEMPWKTT